jgi:hypothetical protein
METRVLNAISEVHSGDHNEGLKIARAAIRAMRTPTTEMLRKAGLGATSSTEDIAYMWEAMIDAASPQEE